jgi:hypothetical protein
MISNRFWSKQQEGKKQGSKPLSKAHDPYATMKFMPEQPQTKAIQPIPPTTLPAPVNCAPRNATHQ